MSESSPDAALGLDTTAIVFLRLRVGRRMVMMSRNCPPRRLDNSFQLAGVAESVLNDLAACRKNIVVCSSCVRRREEDTAVGRVPASLLGKSYHAALAVEE